MDNALFSRGKELPRRLGTILVYCVCLGLLSFGAGRVVFTLLTLDSSRPSDHLRYAVQSNRSTSSGPQSMMDQIDQAERPSIDVETIGLRNPFAAPQHLAADIDDGSLALWSFAKSEQQPAGAVQANQLEYFSRDIVSSSEVAPQHERGAEFVSLTLDRGGQWVSLLSEMSYADTAYTSHVRASRPDSIAPSLDRIDPEFARMFARLSLTRADIRASDDSVRVFDIAGLRGAIPIMDSIETDAGLSYQQMDPVNQLVPDSVAVFPWLRSVDLVVGPRTSWDAIAPAMPEDPSMSDTLGGLAIRAVASDLGWVGGSAMGLRLPYERADARQALDTEGLSEIPQSSYELIEAYSRTEDGTIAIGDVAQIPSAVVPKPLGAVVVAAPWAAGVTDAVTPVFGGLLAADQSAHAQSHGELAEFVSGQVQGPGDFYVLDGLVAPSPVSHEEDSTEASEDPSDSFAEDEPKLDHEQAMASTERLNPVVIPRPRTPVVADSPVLDDREPVEVDDTDRVVWPDISVTGIVVTSAGRTNATVRLSGQRKVIQLGDQLGEFEVVSIGRDYIEVGLEGEVRQYRIGDGPVE